MTINYRAQFAAQQELANQLRDTETAKRNQAIADAKASGNDSLVEALTLFPTLSTEEAVAWNEKRKTIPASGSGRALSRALSPVSKGFDTLAKLPGSPEAALKGLEAGISGDASFNPFSKGVAVSDIGAGGTELSQNENYRDIGRAVGTAIGGGALAPVISGALGGGALGGAGAGAIVSGVPAAMQPGATWQSVLKAAAIGGVAGGIKGYMSTDGTIKQLPKDLGQPLPTDFASIVNDQTPITDFPSLTGDVPGVPGSQLGNFNPGGAFVGPPELGGGGPNLPPGVTYTDSSGSYVPAGPPPGQTIEVTGKLPTGGTGGFSPLPPMYTGSPGPIPEGPQPVDPIELDPDKPLPELPKPAPNYGKLISSLLGNLLSTGGSGSGGGGYGSGGSSASDKLARSLRQPSEPVTMTNPNYIPR